MDLLNFILLIYFTLSGKLTLPIDVNLNDFFADSNQLKSELRLKL